jgi:hypothetical protein
MKAFPTPSISVNDEARITSIGGDGGMDLRDYFAAKALQGIMVDPMMTMSADKIADWAYEMADAMLKAREA